MCFSFRLQQDVWSHISICCARSHCPQTAKVSGHWCSRNVACTPTLSYPIIVNKPQITGLIGCRVSVSACGYVVPTCRVTCVYFVLLPEMVCGMSTIAVSLRRCLCVCLDTSLLSVFLWYSMFVVLFSCSM